MTLLASSSVLHRPDAGLTSRRIYACVAVSLVAFTVYVSLLPFRLQPLPAGLAWRSFAVAMTTWPDRMPRANFIANLLLFVPIGFALAGARLADRRGSAAAVAATALLTSVTVSLVAECLQVFAPRRVASVVDVVAQTTGCVIGLGAWALSGQAFTAWIRESRAHTSHHRLTRVLVGYAALWVFANWAPFDITLAPDRLAARLREGSISLVPFSQPFTARAGWDAVVTVVSSLPIGLLAVSGWWTRPTRREPLAAAMLGIAAVTMVELAQIVIRSHAADATDVVCGAVGVVGGVYVGRRVWRGEAERAGHVDVATNRLAWAGVALWCVMLAGYHWQPFDFGIDEGLVRRKLARLSLLPFAGYRAGSDLVAFNNLLAKAGVALPLGLLTAFALPRSMTAGPAAAVWFVMAGAVFGVIEAGQLFVPSRIPDPTDVWFGMSVGAAGLWLGRWLRAGYGRAPVEAGDVDRSVHEVRRDA